VVTSFSEEVTDMSVTIIPEDVQFTLLGARRPEEVGMLEATPEVASFGAIVHRRDVKLQNLELHVLEIEILESNKGIGAVALIDISRSDLYSQKGAFRSRVDFPEDNAPDHITPLIIDGEHPVVGLGGSLLIPLIPLPGRQGLDVIYRIEGVGVFLPSLHLIDIIPGEDPGGGSLPSGNDLILF